MSVAGASIAAIALMAIAFAIGFAAAHAKGAGTDRDPPQCVNNVLRIAAVLCFVVTIPAFLGFLCGCGRQISIGTAK